MRPVNLLPESERPRAPRAGQGSGSSNVVLGVLAGLLLMVVVYVLFANQVSSRETEIAETKAEADQAEARAKQLAPYAAFAQIKATREQSVRTLANGRFDWERLMRELALVLPDDTWVTEMTTSASGETEGEEAGGASSASGSESAGPGAAASGAPTMHLVGCAKNQPDVAVLMVRLRKLHSAADVRLVESSKQEEAGAGAATSAASSSSSDTASGAEECPDRWYGFDLNVSFKPLAGKLPGEKGKDVPARLGGGS
jgi:Tfp pilus assembly protein PilN